MSPTNHIQHNHIPGRTIYINRLRVISGQIYAWTVTFKEFPCMHGGKSKHFSLKHKKCGGQGFLELRHQMTGRGSIKLQSAYETKNS